MGRDMMGTMANTLIFAYVGGSLSTLVVNYAYNLSYNQLINSYVIGTEIMQGLSGTLGVVLTVPITAAVAAVLIGKKKIVKEPLMQDIYDGSDDYEEPETDGEYRGRCLNGTYVKKSYEICPEPKRKWDICEKSM